MIVKKIVCDKCLKEIQEDETVYCDEKTIKKCEYGANISGGVFCNYLEIEGHSRPCPPEACTCFKKKTRKRRGGAMKNEID